MVKISAIVMAAGFSRRMGGVNKLLAEYRGQALFLHVLDALKGGGTLHELIVVAADDEVLELAERTGAVAIRNDAPELGISRSAVLGTQAATGTHLLFATGDQPRLDARTVERLVAHCAQRPERIVCPVADGRRGSPCIFPAAYREELLSLTGDEGGKAVMRRHPGAVDEVEVEPRALDDIDTAEDLERLRGEETECDGN